MNRRPVSLADPDYRKMLFGFSTRFGTPPLRTAGSCETQTNCWSQKPKSRSVPGDIDSSEALRPATDAMQSAAAALQNAALYVHRVSRSEEHTSELQSLRHLVCRL